MHVRSLVPRRRISLGTRPHDTKLQYKGGLTQLDKYVNLNLKRSKATVQNCPP